MELNVNSPAYFSENFGADEEVCRFCRDVYEHFKDKQYSNTLSVIGILPAAAPEELYAQGMWKERVSLLAGSSCASITVRMELEPYREADGAGRVRMLTDCIIKAVKKVKTKGSFHWELFREDISAFRDEWLESCTDTA